MRVLLAHCRYRQPGGEDGVFRAEASLLEARHHHVHRYSVSNDRLVQIGLFGAATTPIWNTATYRELRSIMRGGRFHAAHFHNTFPFMSPSAYYAARTESLPVVQTIHNYRLLCLSANFFRQGHICQECGRKRVPWPGVWHACYRNSVAASATVAAMLAIHNALRTWSRMVDIYIAVSGFVRERLLESGLPAAKIVVKPNFVDPDPGMGEHRDSYCLFVGRLTPEKGVAALLAAWSQLGANVTLKIVGDGPMAADVADAARRSPQVEWLGGRSRPEVLELLGDAAALIFPSEWDEPFGLVAIEALARGTIVIGSRAGAIPELIQHGRTGLLFRSGDPEDLAAKVEWALGHPTEIARMRLEARSDYEANYTAERNYQRLMEIYELAISRR